MTLGEILAARLREEPEAEVCHLLDRQDGVTAVTVARLCRRAMAFAARLGAPSPERRLVGVCLEHGVDLHAAFLGALWAGHIPTMLAPPSPRMERAKYANAIVRMLEHVRPDVLVVDAATLARLGEHGIGQVGVLDPASVVDGAVVEPWRGEMDEVAVLQHSSGTTGLQKGVALSHRAILAHNRSYAAALGLSRSDRIVSWLPLYHDMGFIACFLMPVLERVFFVEMSPFDWVLRPAMLLDAIHRYRATLVWLPNFAYSFLAQSVRASQLPADLDLGSVRAFVNSSEPVRDASHAAFLERFGRFGARADQLTASYAMAENVYAVTQSRPGALRVVEARRAPFVDEHRVELATGDEGALRFVSNGPCVEGTELEVLGPDRAPLGADRVGELALRGEFRFSGYFRRDDLTAEAILPGGWYLTGDLGFVHEGEVYVTGRRKDLIIVQGRNFYPSDIEAIAGQVPGVNPGRVVAFGIADERSGTEGIVVLCEPLDENEPPAPALAAAVRAHIAQELEVTPADVRIVPPRWLIKSTSGKLARADNRAKYASGGSR